MGYLDQGLGLGLQVKLQSTRHIVPWLLAGFKNGFGIQFVLINAK